MIFQGASNFLLIRKTKQKNRYLKEVLVYEKTI